MKILVIQQKKIGDVLTSTILLEALRQKYPEAELHYLVNVHTIPVLENNPFIDEIVGFTSELQNSKLKFHAFLKKLNRRNYDIVIDVYVKISSSLITYFTKANTRIGYHKYYSSFAYTKTIHRIEKPQHNSSLAIENRLKLLEPLGIEYAAIQPKLYLTKSEIDTAKTILLNSSIDLTKPLVMVSILGSIPEKTYPKAFMVKLLNQSIKTRPDLQLLFNYMPNQKEEVDAIYQATTALTQQHIHRDIIGKGLRAFMALTAQCDAVIGNEGGGNNMAKALGIPTFTIFSPVILKHAWFGKNEEPKHSAVHPSDYIDYNLKDWKKAKKNGVPYYQKMTPELIQKPLNAFLKKL